MAEQVKVVVDAMGGDNAPAEPVRAAVEAVTERQDIKVILTGKQEVIVIHQDTPGVVAYITKCLSDRNINIAFMRLFRESKGEIAYTIVESDGKLPENIVPAIRENPNIHEVMIVQM